MTSLTTMAMLFFSLFLFLSTITVTAYTPDDNFAVNCGNSGKATSIDGRNWTGDMDAGQFSPIDISNSETAKALGKTIPYYTARLSRSEITYLFPMKTDGQKFIRLYFYPSSYNVNFLRSDSLFSVRAGSHTLLKDFNASATATNSGEETILREYCVNVYPGEMLSLTFAPSLSHPNAYAFVNGIEVVSMPSFLYYTKPDNLQQMMLNGGTQQYVVNNNSALETVYRINVGGRHIPPENDTGIFRSWDSDIAYLEREHPESISSGFGLKLIYRDDQNYFAPDEVYLTARNYGMNEISIFNVTWAFEVDSEFYYMVRLHFCEFDTNIENTGDRVFQIFINDALVEHVADVMLWSGNQRLVPVHRDYAVSMPSNGSLKKRNISIELQPYPTAGRSYRDVLLNGIEILKISDSGNNLGGSDHNQPPLSLLPKPSNKNPQKMRTILIALGSASGIIFLSVIGLLTYCRLARAAIKKENSKWGSQSVSTTKTSKSSLLPSNLCRRFTISELKSATNNFNDSFIIGVGGFGNVYIGHIDHKLIPVAIKRLREGSQQGLKEFQTDIEMLSQLRHNHLVSLIGYCNDDNEMILIYEFMARGTFREHLYDSENQPLTWNQRLEICLGAARGLHYLHTGAKHAIIHRDVKSTNILIDENWMAKISDFGLSKIGPAGITRSNINISTIVKGSIGYLDPEYYTLQILTDKSDVYSFGVVLLEALCGRPPILRAVERQQQNLVEWFRRCVDENEIYNTVDPFIRESIPPECLEAYTYTTLQCLVNNGNERPSMGDVMLGLESVRETLHKAEKTKHGGTLNEEITLEEGWLFDQNL